MKKYSFLAAALLLLGVSCKVKVENNEDKDAEEKTEVTTTTETKTSVVKDPVCGMEKDNTWTEFSVSGTDTTWFCSPHCKEQFAKKEAPKEEEKKG